MMGQVKTASRLFRGKDVQMMKRTPWLFVVIIVLMTGHRVWAEEANKPLNFSLPAVYQLSAAIRETQLAPGDINITTLIERLTSKSVDVSVLPFPRILERIKVGATDFGVFMESEKRSQMAHLIHRLYDTAFVLVSPKGSGLKTFKDLEGKKVGISRRGVSDDFVASIKGATFLRFSSHKPLMSSLLVGKIDAFMTPDFRLVELVEQLELDYQGFDVSLVRGKQYVALYSSHKFAEDYPEAFETLKNLKLKQLENFGISVLRQHYSLER